MVWGSSNFNNGWGNNGFSETGSSKTERRHEAEGTHSACCTRNKSVLGGRGWTDGCRYNNTCSGCVHARSSRSIGGSGWGSENAAVKVFGLFGNKTSIWKWGQFFDLEIAHVIHSLVNEFFVASCYLWFLFKFYILYYFHSKMNRLRALFYHYYIVEVAKFFTLHFSASIFQQRI